MKTNKLLQLIKDNARSPSEPPALRAEKADDGVRIYIDDVIDSWFGASNAELVKALAGAGDQVVHAHVDARREDFVPLANLRDVVGADGLHLANGPRLVRGVGELVEERLEGAQDTAHLGGVDDRRVVEGAGHDELAAERALEVEGTVLQDLLGAHIREDDQLVVEARGVARIGSQGGD